MFISPQKTPGSNPEGFWRFNDGNSGGYGNFGNPGLHHFCHHAASEGK
jgi:hypothetical protein